MTCEILTLANADLVITLVVAVVVVVAAAVVVQCELHLPLTSPIKTFTLVTCNRQVHFLLWPKQTKQLL
jgi:hypothetical protein